MVVIPGMETFLRDKMTASDCTAFNVRAKGCSHDMILIANQISGRILRHNVVNNVKCSGDFNAFRWLGSLTLLECHIT